MDAVHSAKRSFFLHLLEALVTKHSLPRSSAPGGGYRLYHEENARNGRPCWPKLDQRVGDILDDGDVRLIY